MQLSAHFRPNIGGVETHLTDLANVLTKKGWEVLVLTYKPLTTNSSAKIYDKEDLLTIIRIPWFPGLFYKLVDQPIFEFLYLLPGLFLVTPWVLILSNPDVIHAHGLVAGFVGVFWGKVFNKRVIISTHSIYNFPQKGLYTNFAGWIFKNASFCLGLSKQAAAEIKSLGVPLNRIDDFIYWVDLENFRKIADAKKLLGWEGQFVVLFVGRFIEEKGINELLKSAKDWNKNVDLKILGSGPLENKIQSFARESKNIFFLGSVDNKELSLYYSGSDILIIPSTAEEGFGRVILESLACGTPVIGSNRGAIPDALDSSVGKLIDVSIENIKQVVEYFYNHRNELKKLAKNCRKFAERKYSEKNADTIIRTYTE